MLKRRTFFAASAATVASATLPGCSSEPESNANSNLPPFKLFDTHAHFYSDDPDKYPFKANRSRYGEAHMIGKAMSHPMNPETVFKFWDTVGVEMGTGVQYSSTYQTDNSYLLDMSAQYPDRILPVVILGPTDPTTPAMLEKFAKENRMAGVRFTGIPNEDGEIAFLSDAAKDSWAAANELGISIVLMPFGSAAHLTLGKIGEFADQYSNVKIVLDHIGYPRPHEMPDTYGLSPQHYELPNHDNIYYKFTNFLISEMEVQHKTARKPMMELKSFMQHMVDTFGADHMVWGSDYGNVHVDDIAYVQHSLNSAAGLTLQQQKAIFYDTAKSVFIPGGRGSNA